MIFKRHANPANDCWSERQERISIIMDEGSFISFCWHKDSSICFSRCFFEGFLGYNSFLFSKGFMTGYFGNMKDD